MNSSVTFKCPDCGAWLEYSPEKQKLVCPFCASEFTEEEAKAKAAAPASPLHGYHCQSCGAEIVTGPTTAATRCYFCHSPVVLSDRLDEEYTPDSIIPFSLTADQAKAEFRKFIQKHRYVDKRFFSDEQMENFSGVYYPYWCGTIDEEASFDGEGTRVSTFSNARETVTTTRIFSVRRQARLTFPDMIRKALTGTNRKLSDGIFPFDLTEAKPFKAAYLSGFLAEKRDIESAAVAEDMKAEAARATDTIMRSSSKFNSLQGKVAQSVTNCRMDYLLLPVWVLTYQGANPEEPFVFMMNGQKGTICGKLPIDKKRLFTAAAMVFACIFGLLCLGGKFIW